MTGRKRMKQCCLVICPQGQDVGSSHLKRLSTEPMLSTIPTSTFRVSIYWKLLSNLRPLLQTKLLFNFSTDGLDPIFSHQRNQFLLIVYFPAAIFLSFYSFYPRQFSFFFSFQSFGWVSEVRARKYIFQYSTLTHTFQTL